MFGYHLKIAIKSLRRNPVLTVLLIGGIALGICVSTSFVTLRHLFKQDPLPGKTDRVFYVQLDSWGKATPYRKDDPKAIPDQVRYRDARGLMRSPIPVRQVHTFITAMFIHPDPKVARPYQADVRLTNADLFDLFEMPFLYGGPWTKAADEKREQVIVIDHETNERLFGGTNSVGKTVRLETRDFRIVGVLEPWRPPLRWFELNRNPLGPPEPMYIPFNLVEPLEIFPAGNSDNWRSQQLQTHLDWLNSSAIWIQYWVELPDANAVAAYREWVRNYVDEQRRLGVYERPTNFKLSTIPEVIDEMGLMPGPITALSVVSLLFLAVCSLNLVGILLGKFLARIPEVSVRRALGASRAQIFWQHIIECELIGVVGGVLGITFSVAILSVLSRFLPNGEALRLDGEMLGVAAFLSLVAGLLAGIYPAWRVCSVPPAMQLKVQ